LFHKKSEIKTNAERKTIANKFNANLRIAATGKKKSSTQKKYIAKMKAKQNTEYRKL